MWWTRSLLQLPEMSWFECAAVFFGNLPDFALLSVNETSGTHRGKCQQMTNPTPVQRFSRWTLDWDHAPRKKVV